MNEIAMSSTDIRKFLALEMSLEEIKKYKGNVVFEDGYFFSKGTIKLVLDKFEKKEISLEYFTNWCRLYSMILEETTEYYDHEDEAVHNLTFLLDDLSYLDEDEEETTEKEYNSIKKEIVELIESI